MFAGWVAWQVRVAAGPALPAPRVAEIADRLLTVWQQPTAALLALALADD
jgi:hypothetical protein